MSARRPVGPVDTIWLRMDRPTNLMVIDSVMWLDAPLDMERLRSVLHRRLVDRFPVFHQRIAEGTPSWLPPQWEDDPDFDLDHHLTETRLADGAGEAELSAFVESRMRTPLDRAHPLWEIAVVLTGART